MLSYLYSVEIGGSSVSVAANLVHVLVNTLRALSEVLDPMSPPPNRFSTLNRSFKVQIVTWSGFIVQFISKLLASLPLSLTVFLNEYSSLPSLYFPCRQLVMVFECPLYNGVLTITLNYHHKPHCFQQIPILRYPLQTPGAHLPCSNRGAVTFCNV